MNVWGISFCIALMITPFIVLLIAAITESKEANAKPDQE